MAMDCPLLLKANVDRLAIRSASPVTTPFLVVSATTFAAAAENTPVQFTDKCQLHFRNMSCSNRDALLRGITYMLGDW